MSADGITNPADTGLINWNIVDNLHSGWAAKRMKNEYKRKFGDKADEVTQFISNWIAAKKEAAPKKQITEKDLRDIQSIVKQKYGVDFDISGAFQTDKGLADRINNKANGYILDKPKEPVDNKPTEPVDNKPTEPVEQSKNKQVANTNAGVASANPGDWIIRSSGERVVLSQKDIDWAKNALNKKTETKTETKTGSDNNTAKAREAVEKAKEKAKQNWNPKQRYDGGNLEALRQAGVKQQAEETAKKKEEKQKKKEEKQKAKDSGTTKVNPAVVSGLSGLGTTH